MYLNDKTDFIYSKPQSNFLREIAYSYFYINIDVSQIFYKTENIIPYPKVTMGYFFEHPFNVYNISRNELRLENSLISKVTKDRIIVTPTTDRIKILGVHLKPYAIALLSDIPVCKLKWSMTPFEIMDIKARKFDESIRKINTVPKLFDLVEKSLLDALRVRDFDIIDNAIKIIENSRPLISVSDLAKKTNLTQRTLRNYFQNYIGCSPKDYLQIVRFQRATYEMLNAKQTLTETGYNADFYDQAHFIKSFKSTLGKVPKEIQKEIENLRFIPFS